MRFYLGTHMPDWLERTSIPLFISRRRLEKRKTFPRALGKWSLDSGGFTEVSQFGGWEMSADEYAEWVLFYADQIGRLEWAAPQDWMCEPFVIQRTGLSVERHQNLTVENFVELRDLLGPLVVPVLQGWDLDDYLACLDLYEDAGVDLAAERLVGVGSVCRRQSTSEAEDIFAHLADANLRLHGFGIKTNGLKRFSHHLASADSMSWSFTARRERIHLPGHSHQTCQNCFVWAMRWRIRLMGDLSTKEYQ